MEGNEKPQIKQEFDTSIVKIDPDFQIKFEERLVKKEPLELKQEIMENSEKDNVTFRVPADIVLEPPSSIKRPEVLERPAVLERPSLPPTPVLMNTHHKKFRRLGNLAIDFTGNQGATKSPTPPEPQVNSEELDQESRDSSPDNLVIAETSSTASSTTEVDTFNFKPPVPERLKVSKN